jgi:hypothetical protein
MYDRKGGRVNLDYLEQNADYVATLEEALRRLHGDGRLLTTQSLYSFVGDKVAGSKAAVAEFLKERGDAPQEDAFWDLRGRISAWITEHGFEHDLHQVALYLARIAAEVRWGHDTEVLSQLHTLAAAQPPDHADDAGTWTYRREAAIRPRRCLTTSYIFPCELSTPVILR